MTEDDSEIDLLRTPVLGLPTTPDGSNLMPDLFDSSSTALESEGDSENAPPAHLQRPESGSTAIARLRHAALRSEAARMGLLENDVTLMSSDQLLDYTMKSKQSPDIREVADSSKTQSVFADVHAVLKGNLTLLGPANAEISESHITSGHVFRDSPTLPPSSPLPSLPSPSPRPIALSFAPMSSLPDVSNNDAVGSETFLNDRGSNNETVADSGAPPAVGTSQGLPPSAMISTQTETPTHAAPMQRSRLSMPCGNIPLPIKGAPQDPASVGPETTFPTHIPSESIAVRDPIDTTICVTCPRDVPIDAAPAVPPPPLQDPASPVLCPPLGFSDAREESLMVTSQDAETDVRGSSPGVHLKDINTSISGVAYQLSHHLKPDVDPAYDTLRAEPKTSIPAVEEPNIPSSPAPAMRLTAILPLASEEPMADPILVPTLSTQLHILPDEISDTPQLDFGPLGAVEEMQAEPLPTSGTESHTTDDNFSANNDAAVSSAPLQKMGTLDELMARLNETVVEPTAPAPETDTAPSSAAMDVDTEASNPQAYSAYTMVSDMPAPISGTWHSSAIATAADDDSSSILLESSASSSSAPLPLSNNVTELSSPSIWLNTHGALLPPMGELDLPPSSPPSSPGLTFRSSSPLVEDPPSSDSLHAPSSSPLALPAFLSHPSTEYGDATLVDILEDKLDQTQSSPVQPSRTMMSSPGPSSSADELVTCSSPVLSAMVLGKHEIEAASDNVIEMANANRTKRFRADDTISSPIRSAPAPKRATQASQRRSHKKLVTPFRSPLTARTLAPPVKIEVNGDVLMLPHPAVPSTLSGGASSTPGPSFRKPEAPNASKTMTRLALASKAASQFRSPFAGASADHTRTVILPTPTIQNLERRVTLLRRAVKIKNEGDEEKLEGLAKKWREAGREAAYELWSIVREFKEEDSGAKKADWGWGAWDDKQEGGGEGAESGGMEVEKAEEEVEEVHETLGVMLRKLGIAPDTLGWNDAEETFVDE